MKLPDLFGQSGGLVHSNVPPEISLDISLLELVSSWMKFVGTVSSWSRLVGLIFSKSRRDLDA